MILLFLFVALCVPRVWGEFADQSDPWQNFTITCPKREGVHGLTMEQVLDNGRRWFDWKFAIKCQSFVSADEDDDGYEYCRYGRKFFFGENELVFEDKSRNCQCNEYLVGLKGIRVMTNKTTDGIKFKRQIQLRCCRKRNNYIDVHSCNFIGPKFYHSPADVKMLSLKRLETDENEDEDTEKPREFLTGLTTTELHQVIAQFCTFAVLDVHDVADKIKKKIKKGYCSFFLKRKKYEEYEKKVNCEDWRLGGWPIPFTLTNQDAVFTVNHDKEHGFKRLLFNRQETVCRDGNQIRSFHKYNRRDPESGVKDYIFLTKCMDFEGQACLCGWNSTCDEQQWGDVCGVNKTKCRKYIGGFRSEWNNDTKQREIELFCCISTGFEHVECNLTEWQRDDDIRVILPRPRFQKFLGGGGREAKGFRDLRVMWEGKKWNSSQGYPCSFPCFPVYENETTSSTLTTSTTTTTQTTTTATVPVTAPHVVYLPDLTTLPTLSIEFLTEPWQTTTTVTTMTPTITPTTTSTTTTPTTTSTTTTQTTTTTTTTATTTTTTTTSPATCEQRAKQDIIFLVDESGSVKAPNYELQKQAIVNIMQRYNVGLVDTRFGLIEYSTDATIELALASKNTIEEVTNAVLALTYDKGFTCITCALRLAKAEFARAGRTNVPQVLVLVTDGRNNRFSKDLITAAASIQFNGVVIFAVGISSNIDLGQLIDVVGGFAYFDRVLTVTDFTELITTADTISATICEEVETFWESDGHK